MPNFAYLAQRGRPMLEVNPAKENDDEAEAGDLPEVRTGIHLEPGADLLPGVPRAGGAASARGGGALAGGGPAFPAAEDGLAEGGG